MGRLVRLRQPPSPEEPLASVLAEFAANSQAPDADGGALWAAFSDRERGGCSCRELLLKTLVVCSSGRCCYCEFGEPTSVEHFWPKTSYPANAFSIRNLMPVCVKCNGVKGARFPLDAADRPVLLDLYEPADDPVAFLAYTEQGGVGARRPGPDGARADKTIAATRLERQWLADRRKATRIGLVAACAAYSDSPSAATAELLCGFLTEPLYHRGVIRYLLGTDTTVRQAVHDAASTHLCVAEALAKPPYTW